MLTIFIPENRKDVQIARSPDTLQTSFGRLHAKTPSVLSARGLVIRQPLVCRRAIRAVNYGVGEGR